jgi:phenylacetate-CoA ligase
MLEQIESAPRSTIETLQLKRLKQTVALVYEKSALYRHKLKEAGVSPSDITKLADIRKLPITTKEDLRYHWPFGAFCVPVSETCRIHTTSGTTGKPVVIGFTRSDWATVVQMSGRAMNASTIGKGDIVQNTTPYGLFFAGASTHDGVTLAGGTIIPVGAGGLVQQLEILEHFKPNVIMGVPSYILGMAKALQERGLDATQMNVRKLFLLGEPLTAATLERLEAAWNAKSYSGYGITEVGVSGTCIERNGYHWPVDHTLVECISIKDGEPVGDGEEGQLVYTTITRDGVPLLRFNTSDISSISYETCSCGRTLPKIAFLKGRLDDRTKIKGTLVYPRDIEEAVFSFKAIHNFLAVVNSDKLGLDVLIIYLETNDPELSQQVSEAVKALTNIKPLVHIVKQGVIPRGERKTKRFIDARKQNQSDLDILSLLQKNIFGA